MGTFYPTEETSEIFLPHSHILQMKKLRLSQVKCLVPRHMLRQAHSQGWNLGPLSFGDPFQHLAAFTAPVQMQDYFLKS